MVKEHDWDDEQVGDIYLGDVVDLDEYDGWAEEDDGGGDAQVDDIYLVYVVDLD
jgi:hypothetical protein